MPGLDEYRDRHKGRKCYVFCSGPSLNWFDCDKMARDGVTICCNASIMALKSCDYFLFTDPRVPKELAYYPTVFDKAGTVVAGNRNLYDDFVVDVPDEMRSRFVVPSPRRGGLEFARQASQLVAGNSVVQVAAHFALVLGCEPIILVGVDLSWGDGQKYFYDRTDPKLWPWLGREEDEATDETLKWDYNCWREVKSHNPDLPIFVANRQSKLCELYPWIDLSEFHK